MPSLERVCRKLESASDRAQKTERPFCRRMRFSMPASCEQFWDLEKKSTEISKSSRKLRKTAIFAPEKSNVKDFAAGNV